MTTQTTASRFSNAALYAALAALALVILPMLLFRLGQGFQFQLIVAGFFVTMAALALAVVAVILAFVRKRRKGTPLLALGVTGGIALVMLSLMNQGQGVPPIHDITTDTDNPPAFVEAVAVREGSPNPVGYDPDIAAQQREAYPDLDTLALDANPAEAFAAALAAIEARGWSVIDANESEGRIEATESSRWFGFKDDVVVRIQPDGGGGSLVDVRSKSRMGQSDLGANAARIRALLTDISPG
ncbi:MAG: DUF1499 domain-containing protein [Pacificimonas sp.]|jgi:uncharacterized protein (DUF1499 family)|nr:DUF1499 domain-containing protein [Pacificimonas sp.]